MKREDLEVRGNRILVKEFENDTPHFNWKTLIEVNPQQVNGNLANFMNSLLSAIIF